MMTKNRAIKAIAAVLAILMLSASLVSCSGGGEAVMTLGRHEISENLYQLYLSRVKGNYDVGDSALWREEDADGRTYNEIFTEFVQDNMKTMLCAMKLFDDYNFRLPEDAVSDIDADMKEMLDERAGGSKSELNAILANYGVNYDILRDSYIMEAKVDYLEEYLYGEDGVERITVTERNRYYSENYVHIKQIFLYTANKPQTDSEGNYKYDDEGNVLTRDFTDAEIAEQERRAKEAMSKLADGADFDSLIYEYSEDDANTAYPAGYYFTKGSQYVEEVVEAAFELPENEYTMLNSEYGIHIIKRLPLEEKGYATEQNKDFFTDFEENLKTELFTKKLKQFEGDIVTDEELLGKYDIIGSKVNLSY